MTDAAPAIVAEPEIVPAPAEKEAAKARPEPEKVEAPKAEAEAAEPVVEAPELAEWEDDDGTKYSIPPALVPKLLKNKDYTVKTQTLAEQRKALAEQEAQFEALRKRDADDLKVESEIFRLSEEIKQYETVDWDRLYDESPERAQRAHFNLQRTRDRLATLNDEKAKRHTERSEAHKQTTLKRMQEAEEYAAANIPGWGAERSAELWGYAIKELGYDEHALVTNLDARLMKLIHKSWVGDKAMAKARSTAPKTPGNVEPLKTVGGKSDNVTSKSLKEMDMEEYVAFRKREMAASSR